VVLPEILADQDAQAFENLVTDSVSVLLVDRGEPIDVEQNQRHRISEAASTLELLREYGVEQRTGVQRRQLVDDCRVARLELYALGVRREHVDRGAADQLRDERPRLAGRPDRVAHGELIERASFEEIDEGKQPAGKEPTFLRDAMERGHTAAASV